MKISKFFFANFDILQYSSDFNDMYIRFYETLPDLMILGEFNYFYVIYKISSEIFL